MNWLWMVVGTYLAYAIAMVAIHPQFIYPFGADVFDDPAYVQQVVTDRAITVASVQGEDPAAVLFFMGNGGSLAYFSNSLDAHKDAGRTVAALQFRGGGGVAGKPSETTLKADALAAYDWLDTAHDGPIVVHGFSLGTGLALHVAARRDVGAVILDAPYVRLCSLMTRAAYVPACYLPWVQRWESAADVGQVTAPVLIQHGAADQLISVTNGQRLSELMQEAGLDVSLQVIPDATHNNLAGQRGYGARITAFLTRVIAAP